jgi:hypothetical protein
VMSSSSSSSSLLPQSSRNVLSIGAPPDRLSESVAASRGCRVRAAVCEIDDVASPDPKPSRSSPAR